MTENKQKCMKLVSFSPNDSHNAICDIIDFINERLSEGWQIFFVNQVRTSEGTDMLCYTLVKYEE